MQGDRERLERARRQWRYRGHRRPPFAAEPGPGQESVWDYPRPPRLAPDRRRIDVFAGDLHLAASRRAIRVLETASPPTFYLPRADVRMELLERVPGESVCEWKGRAEYYGVAARGRPTRPAAWSYPDPFPEFESIAGHIAFYPALVDCRVNGERVRPQPGGFYGGWVTSELVGPFKGEPGTSAW